MRGKPVHGDVDKGCASECSAEHEFVSMRIQTDYLSAQLFEVPDMVFGARAKDVQNTSRRDDGADRDEDRRAPPLLRLRRPHASDGVQSIFV